MRDEGYGDGRDWWNFLPLQKKKSYVICQGFAMKLLQSLAFLVNISFCFVYCDFKKRQNTSKCLSKVSVSLSKSTVKNLNSCWIGESKYLVSFGSYPPITYCWTVPLILDHSYLVGNLANSKIAGTKALEPLKSWHFCISNFLTC